jgi:hypothetical protein
VLGFQQPSWITADVGPDEMPLRGRGGVRDQFSVVKRMLIERVRVAVR